MNLDDFPPAAARAIARLESLTDLTTEQVRIPGSEFQFSVIRPASIDPLLDASADDPEQQLPYWAEIWPSGIALAAQVLSHPELVSGVPVIELGCGIGITATAAMLSEARLTVVDYFAPSLTATELTCTINGAATPNARQLNWRDPAAHLLQDDGSRWPLILAADVLYEERDIQPMLEILARMIAIDGCVLLAEPGRRPAKLFIEQARARGWAIASQVFDGPWPDPGDADVIVSVHTMRRNSWENIDIENPNVYKSRSTS